MRTTSRLAKNVGTADRALRVLLGLTGLALTIAGPRSPWGYLGLVLLVTGAVGYCPLYSLARVSTRKGGR